MIGLNTAEVIFCEYTNSVVGHNLHKLCTCETICKEIIWVPVTSLFVACCTKGYYFIKCCCIFSFYSIYQDKLKLMLM